MRSRPGISMAIAAVAMAVLGAMPLVHAKAQRTARERLLCVETAGSGSLRVSDFDNPWGSKSYGRRELEWKAGGPEASDRGVARRIVRVMLTTPKRPVTMRFGTVRVTATCDGVTHSVDLLGPRAPERLSECWVEPARVACVGWWLRDRALGADSTAGEVADEAYLDEPL